MRAIVTTGAPVREGRYDFCLFGVTSPESVWSPDVKRHSTDDIASVVIGVAFPVV